MAAPTPEQAAHVVQLALTPIFLLTGLASMLSVFTTRLGRVADRVHQHNRSGDKNRQQLKRLQLRSRILDIAVLLASLAGGLTCCAALTLFLGEIRQAGGGYLLFDFFGGALVCAVLALLAFSCETILSGRTVREEAQPDQEGAE
jgi:hypothetical protein